MSRSIVLSVLIVTLFLAVLLAVVAPGFVQAELDSAVVAGELDEEDSGSSAVERQRAYVSESQSLSSQEFSEQTDESVTIRLDPSNATVSPDAPLRFDVIVEGATDGISVLDFEITIEGGLDAEFTAFELEKVGDFSLSHISTDNSTVIFEEGLGNNIYEPASEHIVGEITLVGYEYGVTEVNPQPDGSVHDLDVAEYNTTVEQSGVEVANGPPPLPGQEWPPIDLTGDRLYEDLTGDSDFTVADVQELFDNLNREEVQDNSEYYNFSGFDATEITIFDVQALFNRLSAMSG